MIAPRTDAPARAAVGSGEPSLRLVLATGGSGGHVFPALAVAAALQQGGHEVLLLGGRGGMEERLAREAGVAFEGVTTGKLDRSRPDPTAPLRSLWGVLEAHRALRRWNADLVVGFGGYASFPGCAAAVTTGTTLALHETNSVPGLVTRLFARRAALVAICQSAASRALPRARTSVIPFPVREQRVPRALARRALDLPQEAVVTLVMGGSQGSMALNRSVPAAYRALPPPPSAHWVLHAAGAPWVDEVAAATGDLPHYRATGFVDATLAWSAADLAVTRGGYGTLAEAAFHGVPLLVVPLPGSAEDHQRHNAVALAADGAGSWVAQGDGEALLSAWSELLSDDQRAAAARAMAARSPAGGTERLLKALLPLAAGARTTA